MKYRNEIEYLKKYSDEKKIDDTIINEWINKLDSGMPVQYILGNVNFYGNIIEVNNNVLIPRFETELLVEKVINLIKKRFGNKKIKIIDVGTGSGCIAISLKKELLSDVTGIDISSEALKIARKNAMSNGTEINFIQADMTNFNYDDYDVIVSNPPYIMYDEEIMDIVKNNEPHLALYAKENGTYFYRKILEQVTEKNKIICFEIGESQGIMVKELAEKLLSDINVSIVKDYNQKDRFVFIERKDI